MIPRFCFMVPQRTTQELKCLMLSIVRAQYMEVFTSGKPDNQGTETSHVNRRQTLGPNATWVCVCCRFSVKKQTNTKTKQLFMLSTRREQKAFSLFGQIASEMRNSAVKEREREMEVVLAWNTWTRLFCAGCVPSLPAVKNWIENKPEKKCDLFNFFFLPWIN